MKKEPTLSAKYKDLENTLDAFAKNVMCRFHNLDYFVLSTQKTIMDIVVQIEDLKKEVKNGKARMDKKSKSSRE